MQGVRLRPGIKQGNLQGAIAFSLIMILRLCGAKPQREASHEKGSHGPANRYVSGIVAG